MSDGHSHGEEKVHEDIRDLILETDAPKDKAMLLILLRISENLTANTVLTKKLNEQFDKHLIQFAQHEALEMKLFFGGRWVIRVILAALLVGQGAITWFGAKTLAQFEKLQEEVQVLKEYRAEHKSHHDQEERYRGGK